MAILRSFVICQAALTLQRMLTVALKSSFTVRGGGEEKDRRQKERELLFSPNKDNIYAFHSQCQLREAQTWKSIMGCFLKV